MEIQVEAVQKSAVKAQKGVFEDAHKYFENTRKKCEEEFSKLSPFPQKSNVEVLKNLKTFVLRLNKKYCSVKINPKNFDFDDYGEMPYADLKQQLEIKIRTLDSNPQVQIQMYAILDEMTFLSSDPYNNDES